MKVINNAGATYKKKQIPRVARSKISRSRRSFRPATITSSRLDQSEVRPAYKSGTAPRSIFSAISSKLPAIFDTINNANFARQLRAEYRRAVMTLSACAASEMQFSCGVKKLHAVP